MCISVNKNKYELFLCKKQIINANFNISTDV